MENSEMVVIVMTKYIKGSKEVVKYNHQSGKCWVERINGETAVIKSFEPVLESGIHLKVDCNADVYEDVRDCVSHFSEAVMNLGGTVVQK